MSDDKIREAFEKWAKDKGLNIGLNWNNSYTHVALIAWDAWQASRESLMVELPAGKSLAERMYGPQAKGGDELIARETAVDAIQAAGIKVTP